MSHCCVGLALTPAWKGDCGWRPSRVGGLGLLSAWSVDCRVSLTRGRGACPGLRHPGEGDSGGVPPGALLSDECLDSLREAIGSLFSRSGSR